MESLISLLKTFGGQSGNLKIPVRPKPDMMSKLALADPDPNQILNFSTGPEE